MFECISCNDDVHDNVHEFFRSIYIELRYYSNQLRAQLNNLGKCVLCDAEDVYKLLFEKTFAEVGQLYYRTYYNAQLSHEKQMRLTVEELERELQFPPSNARCIDQNDAFCEMHVVRVCAERPTDEVDRMEKGGRQQEVESCDEIAAKHNVCWGVENHPTTPSVQETLKVALPAAYHQEIRPCNGYSATHQVDVEKWDLTRLKTWELIDVEMKAAKENKERIKVQRHVHTRTVIHTQNRIGSQRFNCFRLCIRRGSA